MHKHTQKELNITKTIENSRKLETIDRLDFSDQKQPDLKSPQIVSHIWSTIHLKWGFFRF